MQEKVAYGGCNTVMSIADYVPKIATTRRAGIFIANRKVAVLSQVVLVVTAAILLSGIAAAAAEPPTFEIMGYPLTQHQLTVINSKLVQERSPTSTLMLNGMPASPVQIMILTPRHRHEVAAKEEKQARN